MATLCRHITGHSGLVVAHLPAVWEGPGLNRAADKSFCVFHENHCVKQKHTITRTKINWAKTAHCTHMATLCRHVTGRSGLVVARLPAVWEGPGLNRAADKSFCVFHENHCCVKQKPTITRTKINWAKTAHCTHMATLCRHITGRIGLVVARLPAAREGPGLNRAVDKSFCVFHENHGDTQLWASAAHWLQCLGNSAFTIRGTVNEYQPYGSVIIQMAMGVCSVYSSLQADSKVKFTNGPIRVGGHLVLTDFHSEDPKWTLAYGWHDIDSTINIVLGIIIIIIIIIIMLMHSCLLPTGITWPKCNCALHSGR